MPACGNFEIEVFNPTDFATSTVHSRPRFCALLLVMIPPLPPPQKKKNQSCVILRLQGKEQLTIPPILDKKIKKLKKKKKTDANAPQFLTASIILLLQISVARDRFSER